MSADKMTPGPWPTPEYENDGNGGFSSWWAIGHIAQVNTSEADARLIATAPKMLAVLQGMVAEHVSPYDCVGGWWEDIEAVIAEATGDSEL